MASSIVPKEYPGRMFSPGKSPLQKRSLHHNCKLGDFGEMMEEICDIKDEIEEVKNLYRYITTGDNGENVDPRMMWNNVLFSRDEMFPLKELVQSCDDDLKKLKEMVLTLEKSDNDFNKIKEMVLKVQSMVMKLMIGVVIGFVSVVIFFLIYLFK